MIFKIKWKCSNKQGGVTMNKKLLSIILGAIMILSQTSFLLAKEPNKKATSEPIISLDTSELERDEDEDDEESSYVLYEKIDKITGTIKTNYKITKLQYRIDCGKWNLIQEDLIPTKKFTIEKLPMFESMNTLTIIATDSENNTGTYSVDIYNISDEQSEGLEVDRGDTDEDGLLNYEELYYGTDLNNPDTDGDGLTDYEEVTITDTDPLKPDTDDNGILDGDEDFDEDGLTNIEEMRLNGDPYNQDTDGDGLADGEEVALGTKLEEEDTDEDGLSDGQEVSLGTNPLISDTDGNGVLDGDEKYTITLVYRSGEPVDMITPKISLKVIGSEIDWFGIDGAWDDSYFIPKYIPGYIGKSYDFQGESYFENAVISFEYDGKTPISEKFKPAIYYLNYDTQLIEKLPNQSRSGKTVSAKIVKLGEYILLNEVVFDKI